MAESRLGEFPAPVALDNGRKVIILDIAAVDSGRQTIHVPGSHVEFNRIEGSGGGCGSVACEVCDPLRGLQELRDVPKL